MWIIIGMNKEKEPYNSLGDKVDVISKGSFFSLCKGFTVLHYENDIFILIDFINILQVFYSCYIGIYGNSTLFRLTYINGFPFFLGPVSGLQHLTLPL